jgi:hypothetical protein
MPRFLATAAIVSLAAAGMASAQSLADVAEKEKARRAKAQDAGAKPKTFTEEDLKKGGSGNGTYNVGTGTVEAKDNYPQQGAGAQGRRAAQPGSGATASQGDRGEASWRSRGVAARERVRAAQEKLTRARQSSNWLSVSGRQMGQEDYAKRKVDAAEGELAAAKAALENLEEEARRSNVPAGWVRQD